jgi:hypothetical protein
MGQGEDENNPGRMPASIGPEKTVAETMAESIRVPLSSPGWEAGANPEWCFKPKLAAWLLSISVYFSPGAWDVPMRWMDRLAGCRNGRLSFGGIDVPVMFRGCLKTNGIGMGERVVAIQKTKARHRVFSIHGFGVGRDAPRLWLPAESGLKDRLPAGCGRMDFPAVSLNCLT